MSITADCSVEYGLGEARALFDLARIAEFLPELDYKLVIFGS